VAVLAVLVVRCLVVRSLVAVVVVVE